MRSRARSHWNSTAYRTAAGLILLTALAACGSSTAPNKAGDPSIIVTNDLPDSWVFITWRDGQGIAGRDSVAPHTASQCVRFTAQPDSAYWDAVATENGSTATVRSPTWFNPTDRPAWTLRAFQNSGGSPAPLLLQADSNTPC